MNNSSLRAFNSSHWRVATRTLVTLSAVLLSVVNAFAQSVEGVVKDSDNNPLVGASVYWQGTNVGVGSDQQGRFLLHRVKGYDRLVAAYTGYCSDTVRVDSSVVDFVLHSDGVDVEAVVVDGTPDGNYIHYGAVAKQETISFTGLIKMACCNLAESFENSASVTVGYSDAVSGARQIRMLGLAGIYTQILDESRPIMRGIGSSYSLNYVPGMWLNSIQVSKGVASVSAGHEAITGQINLEHRKPTDEERLFVNCYFDDRLHPEVNITSAMPVTADKRLTTLFMAHYSTDTDRKMMDHDGDGFRDMPFARQIDVANRWLYAANNGIQLRCGVKLTNELREGGMTNYRSTDYSSMQSDWAAAGTLYGSSITNRAFEGYFKAAFPVGGSIYDPDTQNEVRSNLAVVVNAALFDQDSYFGLNTYSPNEKMLSVNMLLNHYFSSYSSINVGLQSNLTNVNGSFDNRTPWLDIAAVDFDSVFDLYGEREAGCYAEYTYSLADRITIVAGLRGDYNHSVGRVLTTPRTHLRLNVTPQTVLRLSAGTGYRTSRIVSDNIGILATGRAIRGWSSDRLGQLSSGGHSGLTDFADLDPVERALTAGGSVTQTLSIAGDRDATLSIDYFYSRFFNQIVVDQEMFTDCIVVYNTDRKAATHTAQVDLNWTPVERFTLFLTYRYNSSTMTLYRADGSTATVDRPLTSRFKTLLNLQYATRFRRWVFDFTAQLNGSARIPTLTADLADSSRSPSYPLFYCQLTHRVGKFSFYAGCENIGDYRQRNPIVSADRPFSTAFNSMNVWGPLMGRKIYAGLRFTIF